MGARECIQQNDIDAKVSCEAPGMQRRSLESSVFMKFASVLLRDVKNISLPFLKNRRES